ncbi:MAG TPA: DUF4038 domain-containing protein [Chthoniobacteraceae bacterium]|nr:DUF4038 domain-containing protein [Chthoniobacteraceae bacterium]
MRWKKILALLPGIFCAAAMQQILAGDDKPAAAFPLKASENNRYLVDQKGAPFLITGDAPQALTVNLSEAEAESYFANRQSHGFNSLWVNLVCNDYTAGRANGKTFDGIAPFNGFLPGHEGDPKFYDVKKPNEAFFARCDAMLKAAAKHGMLVFLDPMETGGWMNGVMLNNGPDACRAYGQFVGDRYKDFPNILWFHGNDFPDWHNTKQDAAATAIARGIMDKDKKHIHTVELNGTSSSTDDPQWEALVGLDGVYTYNPTYAQVLKSYNRKPRPVFMLEANYEFESLAGPVTTAPILRKQEYWTLLSGACGQLYGNHHTWTFDHDWQKFLDTPGARDIAILRDFFEKHAWQNLVPDQDHGVVTAGYGKFSDDGHVADNDYLAAARTADGALAIAYTPVARKFTVDMSKLRGTATAHWFDPTNGAYATAHDAPQPNSGPCDFTTPGKNSAGDSDWVLVLEAAEQKK